MKCEKCGSINTEVVNYEHEFKIRDKKIIVKSKRRVCSNCKSLVYDSKLDNEALQLGFKKYNKKYGIPSEEIIKFRKEHHLSQRDLATLIGCAKKTIISYENNHSIPSGIYESTLRSIMKEESTFNQYLELNKDKLNHNKYTSIKSSLANKNNIKQFFLDETTELSEYNGYMDLNIDKIINLILILAGEQYILKTKLLKEMFYSDFLYYKNNTVSITGLEYAKITLGPVPDQYSKILSYLETEGFIKLETEFYQGDYTKEKIIALKEVNKKVFDESELKIIEKVKEYFKNYTSSEISEYSHQEKAFKETKNAQRISYDYAFDIELK